MKQLQLLWRPPRGGEWAPFEGPVLPYYPYFF
jgi:hypothetical protein